MHTRVIVKCFFEGDLLIRESKDRGAKFRDAADIARVEAEIKDEMTRHWAPYAKTRGPLQFRADTREV